MTGSAGGAPRFGHKVGIVGAGAMGTLFGLYLARCGSEVEILVKSEKDAEHLCRHGLCLRGEKILRVPVRAVTSNDVKGEKDFVFLMVKSMDTEQATNQALPWMGTRTWMVSLQNGLSHLAVLQKIVGVDRMVVGITTSGATRLNVGEARLAGVGSNAVGAMAPRARSGARAVACLLRASGLSCHSHRTILSDLWGKLLINSCINPLGAVLGLRNGELAEVREAKDMMRVLAQEATPVAHRSAGVTNRSETIFRRVLMVCRRTARNQCSMLQDLKRGRRTEVDSITGEIVRRAKELGLSVSTHETMERLVRALEKRGALNSHGSAAF